MTERHVTKPITALPINVALGAYTETEKINIKLTVLSTQKAYRSSTHGCVNRLEGGRAQHDVKNHR